MTQQTTVGADAFGALCNLFHTTHCDGADLTPAEAGDILYHDANPFTCDHARTMARIVLAYLNIGLNIPEADELIQETGAEMYSGHGAYIDRLLREEMEALTSEPFDRPGLPWCPPGPWRTGRCPAAGPG